MAVLLIEVNSIAGVYRRLPMEEGKKKRLGAGRVAFLARKDAIKEKVDAGHTLITVYEEYQKDLGIGYVQFLNYVAKFIKPKATERKWSRNQ
jgi:hypothetical protein